MAKFEVTAPDGEILAIEAPDDTPIDQKNLILVLLALVKPPMKISKEALLY